MLMKKRWYVTGVTPYGRYTYPEKCWTSVGAIHKSQRLMEMNDQQFFMDMRFEVHYDAS